MLHERPCSIAHLRSAGGVKKDILRKCSEFSRIAGLVELSEPIMIDEF